MNKDKILIDRLNNRKKLHVHVMDKRQNNNVRAEDFKSPNQRLLDSIENGKKVIDRIREIERNATYNDEVLKIKEDSSLGKEYQTNLSSTVPEKWESNAGCDYCCRKDNVPSYNLDDYDFVTKQINKIITLKEKYDKEINEEIGELAYMVLPLLREKLNKINNEKDIIKAINFIKALFSFYKSLN